MGSFYKRIYTRELKRDDKWRGPPEQEDTGTTNTGQHSQRNPTRDSITADIRAALLLDARVILTIIFGRRRVCIPSITSVCERRALGAIDRQTRNLALAFNKFKRQTL